MSRTKVVKQSDCACEVHYEPVARSMFIREFWGKLCPAHDAEEKAFRAEARRGHDEQDRERALAREFT